ncbi:VOC family protein [Kangiella shandongensis]|uniref:VOC family protein n=1 Tax=Kangiella shandongensis TaxID=2763258 RepID=UPI001CBD9685|nr:VOC family protein [Kangiella shandongensis]
MKVDHITILVSSLENSMPYYDTLLPLVGFNKERDHIWTDGKGFYFQFRQAEPNTSQYERYGAGMNHLGFSAPTKENVVSIQRAMREAGFEAPEIQDLGGVTALFMKDPDGIRFEISHYPPGVNVVD